MHPSRTRWTHLVRSRHAKLRSRTSQSAQPISAGGREPGRLAKISGRAQLEHEMIDKSIVVVGTTKIEWPDKEALFRGGRFFRRGKGAAQLFVETQKTSGTARATTAMVAQAHRRRAPAPPGRSNSAAAG